MTSRIMNTDDATGEEFDAQTTDHYEVTIEYTPASGNSSKYITEHYRDRKAMNRVIRYYLEVPNEYPVNVTIRRKLAPKPVISEGYKLYMNSLYGKTHSSFVYWPTAK